jgi:hypothetical protein
MRGQDCADAGAPVGSRRRQSEDAAREPEGRGVIRETRTWESEPGDELAALHQSITSSASHKHPTLMKSSLIN